MTHPSRSPTCCKVALRLSNLWTGYIAHYANESHYFELPEDNVLCVIVNTLMTETDKCSVVEQTSTDGSTKLQRHEL